nr:ATP synthase F0 subunit 8 [Amblyseius tsugawai]
MNPMNWIFLYLIFMTTTYTLMISIFFKTKMKTKLNNNLFLDQKTMTSFNLKW